MQPEQNKLSSIPLPFLSHLNLYPSFLSIKYLSMLFSLFRREYRSFSPSGFHKIIPRAFNLNRYDLVLSLFQDLLAASTVDQFAIAPSLWEYFFQSLFFSNKSSGSFPSFLSFHLQVKINNKNNNRIRRLPSIIYQTLYK